MQYESLIKYLSKNRPAPDSPDRLADNIMRSLKYRGKESKFVLGIKASSERWRFIQATRTVFSVAAVFLLAFFVIEHHSFNKRLINLESLRASHTQFSAADAQNAKYMQIGEIIGTYVGEDSLEDMLHINRRSLHYLMSRIKELESENMSFREKLLQYYSDSTINKN